jgi:hypothetical protein
MPNPPLKCTHCSAVTLAVRKRSGFELVMILLTGKRKYVCLNCKHAFRAVDRRRFPRESSEEGA